MNKTETKYQLFKEWKLVFLPIAIGATLFVVIVNVDAIKGFIDITNLQKNE